MHRNSFENNQMEQIDGSRHKQCLTLRCAVQGQARVGMEDGVGTPAAQYRPIGIVGVLILASDWTGDL